MAKKQESIHMDEKIELRFGKNVFPNFVSAKTVDGVTDIYYGDQDSGAKHGHTVVEDGKVVFARNALGRIISDN
jgi:hypothetical protein